MILSLGETFERCQRSIIYFFFFVDILITKKSSMVYSIKFPRTKKQKLKLVLLHSKQSKLKKNRLLKNGTAISL